MFNTYWTKKFSDIFETYDDFKDYYDDNIPTVMKQYSITKGGTTTTHNYISNDSLELTYYLLATYYKNSSIANMDEDQFCFKLFSTIFEYGPKWEKRLNIQNILRNLTDEEIKQGTGTLYNHVYNDGTVISDTNEELTNLNEQNATKFKKAPMEAYVELYSILGEDISKEYMDKFKKLFIIVVYGQQPLLYESEE